MKACFNDRSNTARSSAAASESFCACSDNAALRLTMDTVIAVSIFVFLSLIIISVHSIVSLIIVSAVSIIIVSVIIARLYSTRPKKPEAA